MNDDSQSRLLGAIVNLATAGLVHDNERRWRTFRASVEQPLDGDVGLHAPTHTAR